ncbi:MAG: CDP-alcohol phosphatidyltransferase family protein [Actinomycetes bacterium]
MTVPVPATDNGWRTIPNLISLLRLLCVPVFVWLVLGADRPLAAGVLLAVLGATDWVDGWIARRYDQGSAIGKVLDPVADRILLIAAAVVLLVDGTVPRWVGALVLAREAVISLATLVLAAAGARRIDVLWVGKAGTLALMFALPGFLLLSIADGALHALLWAVTWCFTIGGLFLSYWAAVQYVPAARLALRARGVPEETIAVKNAGGNA